MLEYKIIIYILLLNLWITSLYIPFWSKSILVTKRNIMYIDRRTETFESHASCTALPRYFQSGEMNDATFINLLFSFDDRTRFFRI